MHFDISKVDRIQRVSESDCLDSGRCGHIRHYLNGEVRANSKYFVLDFLPHIPGDYISQAGGVGR